MNEESMAYLLGVIDNYKDGITMLRDAAYYFIFEIAEKSDGSLINIAPDEIKLEIRDIIEYSKLNNSYTLYMAHTDAGEINAEDKIKSVDLLLNSLGEG